MKRDPYGNPIEQFPGLYRGAIEVSSDPEQRKRYRVRVANVHPQEVESDHLPWAELGATFAGSYFGDLPAFEVGDPVWIMFEAGDRRFPVIMGGILNFEGGLPPLPSEQTGDYERTSKRWVRLDRAGNKIEMSPLDDELWVKLETPDGSFVQVSARDGGVSIRAEGRVNIACQAANIQAAESITATTKKLVADVEDEATLRCLGVTNIRAATEINIGEYQPPTTGTGLPVPETTPTINIKAADLVKIESANLIDVDATGEIQVDSASKITIKAVNDLKLETDAKLTILAQGDTLIDLEGKLDLQVTGDVTMDVTGTTTLNGSQKVEINGSADIEVNATSTFKITAGSNITIDGNASVAIDATANMDLSCTGQMSLQSNSRIELSAPVVTIDAQSLAEVKAGSVVQVDGGIILIG